MAKTRVDKVLLAELLVVPKKHNKKVKCITRVKSRNMVITQT